MSFELYVAPTRELDHDDVGLMSMFLDEVAPIYDLEVDFSEEDQSWRLLPRDAKKNLVAFMRSFYSRKYILKEIPTYCNIYVMGDSPMAQMMMQHNMAIMSENIHDNHDTSEYIFNDQIQSLGQSVKGIHEYNKRNHLYAFKYVVETLLDRLSDQGLVNNPQGIKDALFPEETATTH